MRPGLWIDQFGIKPCLRLVCFALVQETSAPSWCTVEDKVHATKKKPPRKPSCFYRFPRSFVRYCFASAVSSTPGKCQNVTLRLLLCISLYKWVSRNLNQWTDFQCRKKEKYCKLLNG